MPFWPGAELLTPLAETLLLPLAPVLPALRVVLESWLEPEEDCRYSESETRPSWSPSTVAKSRPTWLPERTLIWLSLFMPLRTEVESVAEPETDELLESVLLLLPGTVGEEDDGRSTSELELEEPGVEPLEPELWAKAGQVSKDRPAATTMGVSDFEFFMFGTELRVNL